MQLTEFIFCLALCQYATLSLNTSILCSRFSHPTHPAAVIQGITSGLDSFFYIFAKIIGDIAKIIFHILFIITDDDLSYLLVIVCYNK